MNLAYDSRNRLTNGTVKGVIGSYGYDAEGVRQTATFNGATTTYTTSTHAALSQVLKRVSTGGKVTWCVYGLGLLYEVEPDLATMTLDPNVSVKCSAVALCLTWGASLRGHRGGFGFYLCGGAHFCFRPGVGR